MVSFPVERYDLPYTSLHHSSSPEPHTSSEPQTSPQNPTTSSSTPSDQSYVEAQKDTRAVQRNSQFLFVDSAPVNRKVAVVDNGIFPQSLKWKEDKLAFKDPVLLSLDPFANPDPFGNPDPFASAMKSLNTGNNTKSWHSQVRDIIKLP